MDGNINPMIYFPVNRKHFKPNSGKYVLCLTFKLCFLRHFLMPKL